MYASGSIQIKACTSIKTQKCITMNADKSRHTVTRQIFFFKMESQIYIQNPFYYLMVTVGPLGGKHKVDFRTKLVGLMSHFKPNNRG